MSGAGDEQKKQTDPKDVWRDKYNP
jgi:hypothetical protein